MRIKKLPTFFLFVFVIISGCGYTTKAYFLPSSIRTVYVDNFQNRTDQPNLENELRPKLIAAFQDDGNLKVTSQDEADAVLEGEVVGYSRSGLRYANDEAVQEYRLSIVVNFKFKDYANQKVIVKADNFSGDTSFYLTGSLANSEINARSDALDDLAHRILNKIITLW